MGDDPDRKLPERPPLPKRPTDALMSEEEAVAAGWDRAYYREHMEQAAAAYRERALRGRRRLQAMMRGENQDADQ